jgi:signal transduction histidine kinase
LLYSDSDSLHRILLELLTNARKYADPGSTVDLTVEYQGELPARQIQLIIRNIGAGITADELPQIFDKFRRGQGVTKQAIPGTGLGLALVKSLVEHLDGTITAASRPLADSPSWETWFTVTLPQIHNGQTCATA